MRTRHVRILLVSFALICLFGTVNAQFHFAGREFPIASRNVNGISIRYTQGIVVFTMKSKAEQDALRSLTEELNGEILRSWNPTGTDELDITMQIPMSHDPFEVAEELEKYSFVKYAEPNYVSTLETNDTYYSQQWSLNQASNVDINAPEAWNISTGSSSVIIAVLDTGIPMSGSSLTHEDLDNTSHIVLVSGADVYDSDNYPEDNSGHGTAVSGVTGAETNNSLGIAGVGYQCKLMPIRVANISTTPELFKTGVYKAVDNGANVINFSHSFASGSSYLTDAIHYAKDNDCLIVVAAGNQDASIRWPGYYSLSYNNLMAIAGTDNDDDIYSLGNHGLWINVAAPGVDIITTDIPGGSGYESGNYTFSGIDGTSFSAPHVAGSAGLILSTNSSLPPSTTRAILQFTTKDLGDFGFDEDYGWGRINAYDAVRSADGQFTLSGSLSKNECWYGSITLTGNVTIPSGYTLGIASGATVNLNGYHIKSTGGVFAEESGVTWSPENVKIVQGSDLKGHYVSIQTAIANVASGQAIVVGASSHTVSTNLTVASGRTHQINPGATLNFTGNYKLRVEGTLVANGTTSNKITFTRSGGTWYGIELYNASASSQISYSIVQNAQYGVRVINSNPSLSWSTIRYNTVGVQFDNNSFSYGGTLQGNIIEDNFDGIKCYQYSDPAITPNNVIRYNIYNGVYGDATSVPTLGYYDITGHNSLYYNGTEVWSNYYGTINARYNWWGESNPTPNVSGNVDWSNYLNYDPNSGMGKVLVKADASESRGNEFENGTVADTLGIAEVNRAHEALLKEEYARALSLFEDIVGTYPDHVSGRRALAFVGGCLQKLNRGNETVARRDQLVQNYAGKEIFGLSHSLAAGDLIKSEQYAEAIDRCSVILRDFPGTDLAKYALFDLGSIHWYRLADQKTGEKYYRDLIAQWPDDDLAISALATLGEWVPGEHAGPQPQSEPQLTKSGDVPGEYVLFGNYPNPFNPTTTISYTLPVQSDVEVVLYTLWGRK